MGPFLNLLGAVLCLAGAVGTSVVLYEDPTISPAVLWCTIVGAIRTRKDKEPQEQEEPRALAARRIFSLSLLIAFTQYLFDSLHDGHLKILLIAAIILHLAHIFFQGL